MFYPLQELMLRRLQNIMQRAQCQTPIEVKMQSSVSRDADYQLLAVCASG
jgi:hypothetical protein